MNQPLSSAGVNMAMVSVIVPAFNAERFIGQCIESVLGQTFDGIELIVVDDGSEDGTLAVAESFIDERITCVACEHRNAGAARNEGVRVAKGEYLYFLDADDFIAPSALEKMVAAAEANQADVVVCGSQYYDDVTHETSPIDFTMIDVNCGRVLSGSELPRRPFQSFVGWPWDKLFSTSFVKGHGLLFQEQRSTNDAYFVYMALAYAQRLVCLDDVLVSHRTNNQGSLEHTRSKSWRNALSAVASIRDTIEAGSFDERIKRSFVNWVAHFSYWSMATLDSNALTPEVSLEFFDLIAAASPTAQGTYYAEEDEAYAALASAKLEDARIAYTKLRKSNEDTLARVYGELRLACDELELTRESLQLSKEKLQLSKEECERLSRENEALRKSHSYRLGNALIRPFSKLKP